MKKQLLTAVLAAQLLLCAACGTDMPDDVPDDSPAADPPVSTDAPTEVFTAYPLEGFTWQAVEESACISVPIPAEDIVKIYAEAVSGDTAAVILSTKSYDLYAAVEAEDGYTAFHKIGDRTYGYWNSAEIAPFTDVLGKDGLRLSYTVGANAANICYFTFDGGVPEMLVQCNKDARPLGDMLLEIYGSMGVQLNLYRTAETGIVCCSLNQKIMQIFPDADQMYLYHARNLRYGDHRLVLRIDIQTPKNARYVGWIEDGALCLMNEEDMTLPPYEYTPTELPAEGAGYEWIMERMETDFALREKVDPTTLAGDALKEYMDEAYIAGRGVLFLYDVSSDLMFGGQSISGNTEAYYTAGRAYHDMQNPAFPSLSAFETYMRRILSAEMTAERIADATFIEVDGRLYGRMGARGTNIRMRDAGSEIVSVTDTEIVYARVVEILKDDLTTVDKTERHEFIYTKTAEGWRWTELYIYM